MQTFAETADALEGLEESSPRSGSPMSPLAEAEGPRPVPRHPGVRCIRHPRYVFRCLGRDRREGRASRAGADLHSELDGAKSAAEGCEFPGMFG
jgi:hypothetical protein